MAKARSAGMDRRVAALLNSARSANIFGNADEGGVLDLINDYFCADAVEESEEEGEEEGDDGPMSQDEDSSEEGAEGDESDVAEGNETLIDANEPHIDFDLDCSTQVEINSQWQKVSAFDCGCSNKAVKENQVGSRKRGCISQFSDDEVVDHRAAMAELTEGEKDIRLLGIIASLPMNKSDMTHAKPCRKKKREHQRTTYIVDGNIVCREAFKFIYGISQNKLSALLKHFAEHGSAPRVKKSGGRRNNTNAITPEDTLRAVKFVQNFAEDHGLVLPGRVPGFKRDDVRILPTSVSKASVWRDYKQSALAAGVRAVGKSSFFKMWKLHCPYIVVGRPMTDLCWQCKQNNERIRRSANLHEEEKEEILGHQLQHLQVVKEERAAYKEAVQASKDTAAAANLQDLGPHPPNSLDGTIHYSFDFAQQVHYPSSPLQPGPIYFLVPRKCGIFGVCCEAIPQQINYLIDEGMCSGKGANMVLSLLHHSFTHYGLGETDLTLHCDNCSGQNKNRFMLFYLAWRVMTGKHKTISLNFMPAGHTKFAPDWCFGLLKRRFKRCEVHCLDQLARVVEQSSVVNKAQLVGREDGEVLVPVYDWQAFFSRWFRPLKGIKKLHHFRFLAGEEGVVRYKNNLNDVEREFQLVTNVALARAYLGRMPQEILPPGIPEARRQYLHDNIRPFVYEEMRDIVCP